jgi:hypothetical protein
MKRIAILTIEIDYDDDKTNAEELAQAADNLLETSLNTPGIVEEHGEPNFHAFEVQSRRERLLTRFFADDDDKLDTAAWLRVMAERIQESVDQAAFDEDAEVSAIEDAKALFDQITGASYYGFGFRQALIIDEDAREAARVLVERLKHHGAKGLE